MSTVSRIAAVIVALVAPPVAGASAAPRDCAPDRGQRLVVRDEGAVVLRDKVKRRTTFTACATDGGRRVRLGVASSGARKDATVGPFALAGTVVAWGTARSDRGVPQAADLHVVDLRRPRGGREVAMPGVLPAREIAVDASGRAAVLTEVQALVLEGEALRRVDAGARGVLRGLALAGDEATWSHAGEPRRAPLVLPRGDCAVEPGAFGPVDGERAVLAQRTSGLAGTSRIEVVACVRGTGGAWFAIGEERGELAGGVAAALRPQPGGGYAVAVVDLATRAAIGTPAPVERDYDPWALAADGTVVVLRGDALVAHLPDGREVELTRNARGTRVILVDDVLRTVVWDRGSAPLPAR